MMKILPITVKKILLTLLPLSFIIMGGLFASGEERLDYIYPENEGLSITYDNNTQTIVSHPFSTLFKKHELSLGSVTADTTLHVSKISETSFMDIDRLSVYCADKRLASRITNNLGLDLSSKLQETDYITHTLYHDEPLVIETEPCDTSYLVSLNVHEHGAGTPFDAPYIDDSIKYEAGSIGPMDIYTDGDISAVDGQVPVHSEIWYPASGHPDGEIFVYISDDEDFYYLGFDITIDNTNETRGEDFINIRTNDGQEFFVNDFDMEHGTCGFTTTSKVPYPHATCEVRIPKNTNNLNELDFRYSYYGTGFGPVVNEIIVLLDENVTHLEVLENVSLFSGRIISGPDASYFSIDADDNIVFSGGPFDHENPVDSDANNIYTATLQKNFAETKNYNISIADVNLAPTNIDISGVNQLVVNDQTSAGTNIGIITNDDDGEDNDEIYNYSLSCADRGADDGFFTISGINLETTILMDHSSPADADADNTYNICIVVVESNGGLRYEENLQITVQELPPVISPSSSSRSRRSSIRYVCRDKTALNYSGFGRHRQSRCKYDNLIKPVAVSTNLSSVKTSPAQLKCPIFYQYTRKGDRDGSVARDTQQDGISSIVNEISLLQETLATMDLYTGKIDGIFGSQTEQAVRSWQLKHADNVLYPWGLRKPTGRFYQSSKRYMNELLGCHDTVTLDNGIYLE